MDSFTGRTQKDVTYVTLYILHIVEASSRSAYAPSIIIKTL